MELSKFEYPVDITIKLIMSKISEYDIYRYEIGEFTIGKAICNPMRKDINPSFCIYTGENGRLFHRDFADDKYQGGCIDLVCQKYGVDYNKALRKVASDFGITNDPNNYEYKKITSQYTKPVLDKKRHALIIVSARKWEKQDLEYWAQFGIDREQLREEEIYCVKEFSINRKRGFIRPGELCFAYRYLEGFKIYFPTRKKKGEDKWYSNITTRTVEGLKSLKDAKKVLITKAKKDRIVLSRYITDPTTCILNVQNETRSCFTDEFRAVLEGKEVWVNFDNDEPGVKNSKVITGEFGYKYINVPKSYPSILNPEEFIKDYSDLYRDYGDDPIITHLKQKGII